MWLSFTETSPILLQHLRILNNLKLMLGGATCLLRSAWYEVGMGVRTADKPEHL